MPPEEAAVALGEYRRTIDDRFRLSLPPELLERFASASNRPILVKERPGALSLWLTNDWEEQLQAGVELLRAKIRADRLASRTQDVQRLGRLLSTRHKAVQLAGRGRLLIPEAFREFLGVEPGSEVIVVGAILCIEIWQPASWLDYLGENITEFRPLFDDLTT